MKSTQEAMEDGKKSLRLTVFVHGMEDQKQEKEYKFDRDNNLHVITDLTQNFLQRALKWWKIVYTLGNRFHARWTAGDGRDTEARFLNNAKSLTGQGVTDGDIIEIFYIGKLICKNDTDKTEMFRICDPSLDIPRDYYRHGEALAKGAQGSVRVGRHDEPYEVVALKEVSGFHNSSFNAQMMVHLKTEIEIMTLLEHPTIIHLRGVIQATKNTNPVLVMPKMENGSLGEKLSDRMFSFTARYIVLYGVAVGMSVLKKLNVIHRDLKPENVLLDKHLHPVITDFGMSKVSTTDASVDQSQMAGTCAYMAPEQFTGLNKYGGKVDVYSFGVMMWAVLSGKQPFEKWKCQRIGSVVTEAGRPEPDPENVNPKLIDLMKRCWDQNSSQRPEFAEIVELLEQDEYLEGVNKRCFEAYKEELKKYSRREHYGVDIGSGDSDEDDEGDDIEGTREELEARLKSGDVEVAVALGLKCEYGDEEDNHRDYTKAYKCYRKAAEKNIAAGFYHLSRCFAEGISVAKDTVISEVLLEKAKSLGFDS